MVLETEPPVLLQYQFFQVVERLELQASPVKKCRNPILWNQRIVILMHTWIAVSIQTVI